VSLGHEETDHIYRDSPQPALHISVPARLDAPRPKVLALCETVVCSSTRAASRYLATGHGSTEGSLHRHPPTAVNHGSAVAHSWESSHDGRWCPGRWISRPQQQQQPGVPAYVDANPRLFRSKEQNPIVIHAPEWAVYTRQASQRKTRHDPLPKSLSPSPSRSLSPTVGPDVNRKNPNFHSTNTAKGSVNLHPLTPCG
jgi:hypothetical protein